MDPDLPVVGEALTGGEDMVPPRVVQYDGCRDDRGAHGHGLRAGRGGQRRRCGGGVQRRQPLHGVLGEQEARATPAASTGGGRKTGAKAAVEAEYEGAGY